MLLEQVDLWLHSLGPKGPVGKSAFALPQKSRPGGRGRIVFPHSTVEKSRHTGKLKCMCSGHPHTHHTSTLWFTPYCSHFTCPSVHRSIHHFYISFIFFMQASDCLSSEADCRRISLFEVLIRRSPCRNAFGASRRDSLLTHVHEGGRAVS